MSSQLSIWKNLYGLKKGGVIHIGASFAQERFEYQENGFEPVLWVEGLPEVAEKTKKLLENFPKQKLINAVVSDISGESVRMKRSSNNGESSSLFEPGIQKLVHPKVHFENTEIQVTTTIDELVQNNFSRTTIGLLVLDIQGAELLALKGAIHTLKSVEFIFSEVSTAKMYRKQPLFQEISMFLKLNGFSLIEHDLYKRTFHGNALFIKTDLALSRDLKILKTPRKNNLYYLLLIYIRRLRNLL
jgi:FkbM family methyltransferase